MSSYFSLACLAQIESAYFPEYDNLYCKYSVVYGSDWTVISGVEEGITQLGKASTSISFSASNSTNKDVPPGRVCVWNFPLEIAFKSTNAYGWPQIVFNVYGLDSFGRDVIRGYGSLRLPLSSGQYEKFVPTFIPIASVPLNGFIAVLAGRLPEFLDSRFVVKNEGREVTRVKSQGTVKVKLNIITKDLENFGYTNK